MDVKVFVNNAFQENTYVLSHPDTHEALIIDPGMSNDGEWTAVRRYLEDVQLTLVKILLTHCHIDHLMGSGYLADWCSVPMSGPKGDEASLPDYTKQFRLFGLPCQHPVTQVDVNVQEGDVLPFGPSVIEVRDIPGHSYHGLCYYFPAERVLFTGDVLFRCSVGRSDFGPRMGCDGQSLLEGIQTKLLSLPHDVVVYPGHGPSTTIDEEITYNPYF